MTTRIKVRHDTAANWSNANPVLALGEPGFETDTNRVKYGDGTTAWSGLSPIGGSVVVGENGQLILGSGTTTDGGSNSIAIGTEAGIGQAWSTVALGNQAGNSDQSPSAIAIGRSAGYENQDWDAISIGRRAGQTDQQEGCIGIGYYAGQTNQRYHSIAIGSQSGQTNQYWDAISIGKGAGNYNQDHQTIAIGHRAGETSQLAQAIAIGKYAGNENQGLHAIAIGADAGNLNQGWTAIAIGENAGETSQGFRGISIGRYAGNYDQGTQSIAIGPLAGWDEQGDYAISIGRHAGEEMQGTNAIAIGNEAGRGVNPDSIESYPTANWVSGGTSGTTTFVVDTTTGIYPGMMPMANNFNECVITAINRDTNEITISVGTAGDLSGQIAFFGKQGENAIAIGAFAGASVQHPNSIIINASGSEVVSAGEGTMVVQSLRQVTGGSIPAGFYQTAWNPITGEMIVITP